MKSTLIVHCNGCKITTPSALSLPASLAFTMPVFGSLDLQGVRTLLVSCVFGSCLLKKYSKTVILLYEAITYLEYCFVQTSQTSEIRRKCVCVCVCRHMKKPCHLSNTQQLIVNLFRCFVCFPYGTGLHDVLENCASLCPFISKTNPFCI